MRIPINDSLRKEVCYFRLGYYDRNLSIPFVEPLFFLGKGLFETGGDNCFFQHAQQYLEKVSAEMIEDCDRAGIIELSADDLEDIVDWNGLISELVENKRMQDEGKFLSQRLS